MPGASSSRGRSTTISKGTIHVPPWMKDYQTGSAGHAMRQEGGRRVMGVGDTPVPGHHSAESKSVFRHEMSRKAQRRARAQAGIGPQQHRRNKRAIRKQDAAGARHAAVARRLNGPQREATGPSTAATTNLSLSETRRLEVVDEFLRHMTG